MWNHNYQQNWQQVFRIVIRELLQWIWYLFGYLEAVDTLKGSFSYLTLLELLDIYKRDTTVWSNVSVTTDWTLAKSKTSRLEDNSISQLQHVSDRTVLSQDPISICYDLPQSF